MEPHRVLEVEALPFVHALAQSERPADRALFVRIYRDLVAELSRRRETAPEGWTADLQACLGRAQASERELYLRELAKAYIVGESRRPPLRREPPSREAVETILRHGDTNSLVALAGDRATRLAPEAVAALALRARALIAESGDRRLAEAVLAREPAPLEAAALFLEASRAQRQAIMLAAQRAELGRKGVAPRLDAELADRLEFSAIAGQAGEFEQALGDALGADARLAAAIAADREGEPLAVALVALGAPYDLSVRVMTARDLSEEGDGFQRIHTLARLGDRLSAAAARRIVAAMIGRGGAAPAAPAAAPPRQAEQPSPFVRRDGSVRRPAVSPETTARPARNSRSP